MRKAPFLDALEDLTYAVGFVVFVTSVAFLAGYALHTFF